MERRFIISSFHLCHISKTVSLFCSNTRYCVTECSVLVRILSDTWLWKEWILHEKYSVFEGINHCRHIHIPACISIVGVWLAICLVLNLLILLINIYFLYYNSIQRSQLRFSWASCCTCVAKGRHWPKQLPVFPDGVNEQGWRREQKIKLSQGCAKLKSVILRSGWGVWTSQVIHRKNKAFKARNGNTYIALCHLAGKMWGRFIPQTILFPKGGFRSYRSFLQPNITAVSLDASFSQG